MKCRRRSEEEGAVSGGCFMVGQQGMHEDMDAMLREIETGWAMASMNCDVDGH